jgi:hypothetical protein
VSVFGAVTILGVLLVREERSLDDNVLDERLTERSFASSAVTLYFRASPALHGKWHGNRIHKGNEETATHRRSG